MRGYTRENLTEIADISSEFLYKVEMGKKDFQSMFFIN